MIPRKQNIELYEQRFQQLLDGRSWATESETSSALTVEEEEEIEDSDSVVS